MKKIGIVFVLMLGMLLVGCGNSNVTPGNINGTWSAVLTSTGGGATLFNFVTALTVNSDGSLSVVNFTFNSSDPCFVSGDTESGSFTLSGDFNGHVTGKFHFIVQSTVPVGSVLTLDGTANGKSITGTWTLTGGTGCAGNGNFTMTQA